VCVCVCVCVRARVRVRVRVCVCVNAMCFYVRQLLATPRVLHQLIAVSAPHIDPRQAMDCAVPAYHL